MISPALVREGGRERGRKGGHASVLRIGGVDGFLSAGRRGLQPLRIRKEKWMRGGGGEGRFVWRSDSFLVRIKRPTC